MGRRRKRTVSGYPGQAKARGLTYEGVEKMNDEELRGGAQSRKFSKRESFLSSAGLGVDPSRDQKERSNPSASVGGIQSRAPRGVSIKPVL